MHWALPNSTCCTGMELTPRDAIPYTISHVHRRKLTEPQAIYKPSKEVTPVAHTLSCWSASSAVAQLATADPESCRGD